jgi:hypothetical protein
VTNWVKYDNPQPGDFGLVRITGWAGWGIRIAQVLYGDGWSPHEHAFIVMGTDLIEAEPGGARVQLMSEYGTTKTNPSLVFSNLPLTASQRAGIVHKATELVGTPYSWLDYASLALHRLHIRPKFVVNRVRSSKHLICSQLVDLCYDYVGMHLFQDGRFEGDVTPGDLWKLINEHTD